MLVQNSKGTVFSTKFRLPDSISSFDIPITPQVSLVRCLIRQFGEVGEDHQIKKLSNLD